MTDPHAALLRSLSRDHEMEQPLEVLESGSRPWASATFTGARHQLTLTFRGDDAAQVARCFGHWAENFEFQLPGHLVADIRMDPPEPLEDHAMLTMEVLTIETC